MPTKAIDIDTVDKLLAALTERRSVWHAKRLERATAYLDNLTVAIPHIRQKVAAHERANAPRFNIFRLLDVTRDEEKTHSAFLADLLNPSGTHGQQHLFLESFLNMCAEQAKAAGKEASDFPLPSGDMRSGTWLVKRERWIVPRESRVDITIRNRELSYLLVIENKINTGEGKSQLLRYGRWLDSERKYYDKRVLVFLTPGGRPAETAGKYPYYRLSYRKDIHAWLNEILGEERVEAVWFREILKQYLDVVKNLEIPREITA